jgi:hypothetical protein
MTAPDQFLASNLDTAEKSYGDAMAVSLTSRVPMPGAIGRHHVKHA